MGRKRNSWNAVQEFFDGFNSAYSTVGKVLQDREISKIAQEKPDTIDGYSSEDGRTLEAAANAKDADGNPLYKIGTDDQGNYTITGANGGETTTLQQRPSVRQAFLGKTFEQSAPLSEGQINTERANAMAGAMERFGNVAGALGMRNQAQQSRLTDLQIRGAERADRRGQREDDQLAKMEGIDAQVGKFISGRVRSGDNGPEDLNDDDMIAAGRYRAKLMREAGLYDHAQATSLATMNFVQNKLTTEEKERGVAADRAFALWKDGKYLEAFKAYNKHLPDGVDVTDVKRNKDGSLTLKQKDSSTGDELPDRVVPATAVAQMGERILALKGTDAAMKYVLTQEQIRNERARTGIAQAEAGRAADRFSTEKALRQAQGEYEAARQKGDQAGMNAAMVKIAQSGGQVGGTDANAPAEVKLANAYMRAGLAGNLAEGLQMATQSKDASPERVRQDIFKAALTANMGDVTAATKATDEAMKYLGAGGSRQAPAASAPTPPAAAIDFLKKNPGLAAEFDAKYGQGASARVLGK